MFTDSNCLFGISTKSSLTTDKRLFVDREAVCEYYENLEVSNVTFASLENNLADTFFKVKPKKTFRKMPFVNKAGFSINH